MTTAPLLAYHGDKKLKAALLREVTKHEKADQIVAGTYGDMRGAKWVGCAVGCSLHSLAKITGRELETNDHSLYEPEAGVPQALARLQDAIFEGLSPKLRKTWPRRFWKAIRPGADLSRVQWQFLHWLLTRSGIGDYEHELVRDAVAKCAAVLEPLMRGEPADESAARSAESAESAESAASAAWSAARSAESAAWSAESAAWSAESAASAARSAESAARSAESAAWSAESAARSAKSAASAAWSAASAAWSAARSAKSAASAAWSAASAAWSAARSAESAAYKTMSDQLITLLEAA